MADDQGQKITSIDDLVNELTRRNSSAAPPVPPVSGPPSPKPPVDSPRTTPPSTGSGPAAPTPTPQAEIPKPKFTPPSSSPSASGPMTSPTGQAKPAPAPTPPRPTPLPPVPTGGGGPAPIKEYQSSIRTMKDDISILKQGQKPAGISVPRKIETPPPAGGPVAPTAPKPITPPLPGQQFKVPSVSLGQEEKRGLLPSVPTSKQEIKISPPPPPVSKSIPSAPPMPIGRQEKSPIYAPPPQVGVSSSRNRLFVIIAGVAVIFAVLYWFLIIRSQMPEIVEEIPTPTPTATPIVNLSSIFQGISNIPVSFENNPDGTPIAANLNTRINSATIAGGEFQNLSNSSILGLAAFLDAESVNHPQGLIVLQLNEFLPLLYGQIESFNSAGLIKAGAENEKRLVLISEVVNSSTTSQTIRDWELTLSADFKPLFKLGQSKEKEFLDNTYKGVSIRYKNFSYADRSIDYAIVTALNGKSYLVIANSREAIFSTIDKLQGF